MKNSYLSWLFAAFCLFSFRGYTQPSLSVSQVYSISSYSTGQALEIGGGGNLNHGGRSANTWGYWGGAHQQWVFQPVVVHGRVTGYVILNRNSRMALSGFDPNAGSGFSQAHSSYDPAITNSSTIREQLWYLTPINNTPNAPCRLYLGDSYYLTTDGNNNVFKQRFVNNDSQLWNITQVSNNASTSFTMSAFQIINQYSGKALTVEPGDPGARDVKQMTAWGLACEEWTFVPSATTSGYYYIVNRRNGLVLEIGGGNTGNGAPVNLWENYQHAWQEWAFLDENGFGPLLTPSEFTDGRLVQIYSRHAGKVLEIRGGRTDEGGPANVWETAGVPWQKWHIQFSAYNRTAAPATNIVALAAAQAPTTPSISIYPNPASDKLSILGLNKQDLEVSQVQLTDVRGREVRAIYQDGQLDVSALAPGLYFVAISNSKQTVRQKFTKL